VNPVDYALLSQRAYTDAPTIGEPNSASRMHVYGDVHVFRGTDDFMAAIADVNCATMNVWGLGYIHAGFYAAMAAILPACLALPRPAAVTGHSLGAAMAIIYAAVLAQLGCVVPVFAFEPPRLCGDAGMGLLFKAKKIPFYATRNGNDWVTQIPLGLTLPGALTAIGKPSMPLNNITDHGIDRVIAALG
jgi:triacylglycerol lipase